MHFMWNLALDLSLKKEVFEKNKNKNLIYLALSREIVH